MLAIRFVRIGKKKHPVYRIIVMEKGKNPHSAYLENLGTYNPHTKEKNIKKDRVQYWLSQGAELSATLHNLFVDEGLVKAKKVRASKSKPGKKKQAELSAKKAAAPVAEKPATTEAPTNKPEAQPAAAATEEAKAE